MIARAICAVREVSPRAKLALFILAAFADDEGLVRTRVEELARAAGELPRAFVQFLHELRRAGLVDDHSRKGQTAWRVRLDRLGIRTQRAPAAPSSASPDDPLDDDHVRELAARGDLVPLAGDVQVDPSAVDALRERVRLREGSARR